MTPEQTKHGPTIEEHLRHSLDHSYAKNAALLTENALLKAENKEQKARIEALIDNHGITKTKIEKIAAEKTVEDLKAANLDLQRSLTQQAGRLEVVKEELERVEKSHYVTMVADDAKLIKQQQEIESLQQKIDAEEFDYRNSKEWRNWQSEIEAKLKNNQDKLIEQLAEEKKISTEWAKIIRDQESKLTEQAQDIDRLKEELSDRTFKHEQAVKVILTNDKEKALLEQAQEIERLQKHILKFIDLGNVLCDEYAEDAGNAEHVADFALRLIKKQTGELSELRDQHNKLGVKFDKETERWQERDEQVREQNRVLREALELCVVHCLSPDPEDKFGKKIRAALSSTSQKQN